MYFCVAIEAEILNEIREKFSVQLPQIVPTVTRFFQAFKENKRNQLEVGRLTLKVFICPTCAAFVILVFTRQP